MEVYPEKWTIHITSCAMFSENLAPHFDAVSIDTVPRIRLSSPLTDAKVTFASMHIHVGRGRGKGSEHSIDGQFSPMEVKFISQYHKIMSCN